MSYRHVKPLLLMALILLPTAPALALSSDRQQPVEITADSMRADERRGVSHYQGDVFLKQGSLEIRADELTVHLTDGEVTRIIVIGSPAKLQQQPDNREMVYSEARRMDYNTRSGELLLLEDAHVKQGANRFSGERIDYDTRKSIVTAEAGDGDTPAQPAGDSDGRVRAIIEPKDQSGDGQ
jgi:lipopolysaccharide export system protein LptA